MRWCKSFHLRAVKALARNMKEKKNMVNMEVSNVHTSVDKRRHTMQKGKWWRRPHTHGPTGTRTREPAAQVHRRCLGRRLPKIKAQPRTDHGLVLASHSRQTSWPCPHGGQNGASCYCTSGAGPSTPPPPKFAPSLEQATLATSPSKTCVLR